MKVFQKSHPLVGCAKLFSESQHFPNSGSRCAFRWIAKHFKMSQAFCCFSSVPKYLFQILFHEVDRQQKDLQIEKKRQSKNNRNKRFSVTKIGKIIVFVQLIFCNIAKSDNYITNIINNLNFFVHVKLLSSNAKE